FVVPLYDLADGPARPRPGRLRRPAEGDGAYHAPWRSDAEQRLNLIARDHRAGHPTGAETFRVRLQQQRHGGGTGSAELGLHGGSGGKTRGIPAAGTDQLGQQIGILAVLRDDDCGGGLQRLEEEVPVAAEVLGMVRPADDVRHLPGLAAHRIDQRGADRGRRYDGEAPGLAIRARGSRDRGFHHPLEQRAIMFREASRQACTAPRKFTRITSSKSAGSLAPSKVSRATPAAQTSTSGGPSPLASSVAMRWTSVGVATSPRRSCVRAPSRAASSATPVAAASDVRKPMPTERPRRTSSRTTARPMPPDPPVTHATTALKGPPPGRPQPGTALPRSAAGPTSRPKKRPPRADAEDRTRAARDRRRAETR